MVSGCKKNKVQSKLVPKMTVFRIFKSLNIKYIIGTPKDTSLAGTTPFYVFA